MAASVCPLSCRANAVEMDFKMIRARIAEDQDDRRRAARRPIDVDATMRELGATGVEAKVLNISATGFMARTTEHWEVGSRVWLLLPGRERASAVVKWTAGDKLGAEFSGPVPIEALLA